MNLEMFKNGGFEVRGGETDGTPYFVAKDVATMLGYKDTVNAIKRHCKGVAKSLPLSTSGGIQELRVINEPDVWRLIINSHLEEAQKIENWLFNEVIPSIRKNGAYIDQELKEAINTFIPKSGFLEPNKNDELKTKPIRGYYRVDKTSEEAKLLTRRYQLQKRLNSLFIEDIKMELAEIDMNLSELRQLTA